MALENYHEPREQLPEELIDQHRAFASLIEELEAANWYNERRAMTKNPELKAVLEHHRNEELEHAAMLIEWLRRNLPPFAEELDTYLNTSLPITQVEENEDNQNNNSQAPDTSSLNIGAMR